MSNYNLLCEFVANQKYPDNKFKSDKAQEILISYMNEMAQKHPNEYDTFYKYVLWEKSKRLKIGSRFEVEILQ